MKFTPSTSCVPPINRQRYERYETIHAYSRSVPAIRASNSIPPHGYTDVSLSACGRWHIVGFKRFDSGLCASCMFTGRSNSRFPHVSDHPQLCLILLQICIRIFKLRLLCIFAPLLSRRMRLLVRPVASATSRLQQSGEQQALILICARSPDGLQGSGL